MAEMFEEDTIHHALGINTLGEKSCTKMKQRQTETPKRILQWRWLLNDEISMVSAKLLSEVDHKLRCIMRTKANGNKCNVLKCRTCNI